MTAYATIGCRACGKEITATIIVRKNGQEMENSYNSMQGYGKEKVVTIIKWENSKKNIIIDTKEKGIQPFQYSEQANDTIYLLGVTLSANENNHYILNFNKF